MSTKIMWMVRAGEGSTSAGDFREKGVVGIGWGSENWTRYSTKDAIYQKLAQLAPDDTSRQLQTAASQIDRFLRGIKVNHRVVTYDSARRMYLLGTITGEPQHNPKLLPSLPTVRKVSWEADIPRDTLSVQTRNSLGAIQTLFCISDEAAQEIEAGAHSKPQEAITVAAHEEIEEVVETLKGIQSRSHEFLKDRLSHLDWEQMQQIIAGLLRAMGYKTRVSPQGSDRGKDIMASPDGFGLESPRIVVEVKHRKGTMGSKEIRGFLGGRHKDDKGLYVSTGGFTKDALYEADRSAIPLTLMDLDDLARAIAEHYEKMDPEARALIPLKRLYWPT